MTVGEAENSATPAAADDGGDRWLLLVYRVPSEPTRLRAAVWRRLKSLGAVYLQKWAIHFTAISARSQSRLLADRQGRSWGGWARLLGRDRGPVRPGGLIPFGRGLATSCR